ncbi:flagellar biosynthetic protein FliR [Helicovermis profundi]
MIFFLVFTRISGIFTLVPIFNSKNIPIIAKMWFVFFLSLVILPVVNAQGVIINTFLDFGYYIFIEFVIGLLLGAVVLLVLNSLYIAGIMVDRNIGFSMVSVISATDEGQIPVSANLYFTMSMLIFLVTNAHHVLIIQIVNSFKLIPIGHLILSKFIIDDYIGIIAGSFVLGFKIAMPFIITILISNIILGILSKAMPGMNVFMIGMPFKVLVGLIILLVVIPTYFVVMKNMFNWSFSELSRLMEYISGT